MNYTKKINYLFDELNDHILTVSDISKYLNMLITYLEISTYVHDIIFTDDPSIFGTYSFENRTIKINLENIINESDYLFNNINFKQDKILFINLSILEVIYHEITHVIQNCIIDENVLPIGVLYQKELVEKDKISDSEYDDYYSLFSYERDAIITSIENILHIIKNYYNTSENIFNFYITQLYKSLFIGYTLEDNKIVCPAEKLFESLYHEETPTISNIDTYDSMKLGYHVTYRSYKSFKRNKIKKILTKNNLL